MKIIRDIEQGSAEWHALRGAMVTGSKLKRVMGTREAQIGLIAELIAEEKTEQQKVIRPTLEMQRGNDEEVFAVKEFERKTGNKTEIVTMCISDEFPWLAVSPDRLIVPNAEGKYDRAFEAKSPDSKQAVLYRIENMIPLDRLGLLSAKGEPKATAPFCGIPAEYKWQCIDYFLVMEDLETLIFGIYDPRFVDGEERIYFVEINRSNELVQDAIKEARETLVQFRKDWIEIRDIVFPSKF